MNLDIRICNKSAEIIKKNPKVLQKKFSLEIYGIFSQHCDTFFNALPICEKIQLSKAGSLQRERDW